MLAVCGGSRDNGNCVIVSLDGSRLFVANAGNNSVSVFSVDRNGANPTPLATSTTEGCSANVTRVCKRRAVHD